MSDPLPEIELPHFLKPALAAGHPWIYRDHVPRGFDARDGSWVRVRAGGWKGIALWDRRSPIALRVYSQRHVPDARWIARRVGAAWALRAPLRAPEQGTDAYRLIFGEGDGLPGLTVDLYNDFAVVIPYADSVHALVPPLVDALRDIVQLTGIVIRDDSEGPERRGRIRRLWGEWPERPLVVREHGLDFRADLYEGQKSGLFLDQRENRATIERLAAGRSVLNLFAYSGGFSLYAARGGAETVTSVDIAAPAIEDARENFARNGFDPQAHAWRVEDVFDFLERGRVERAQYDLVISDPPSFARSRDQLAGARKAYARLHAMAMRVVAPGGLMAASSCTSQISPADFRELIAEGARQAGRRFQIIHEAGQPRDHPVMARHLEGRYLKFVVGRVLEIV